MAHYSSVFTRLLRLVPRHVFETLAGEHHAGAALRCMSRWKQFVALLAAQLTGRQSLHDIESMLRIQDKQLYHLGSGPVARSSLARVNATASCTPKRSRGVARSALARVNAEQPYTLFEALFHRLAAATQRASPGHRFRFKNPLFSLADRAVARAVPLGRTSPTARPRSSCTSASTTAACCRCSPRSRRRMPRTPSSCAARRCRRAASRCSTRAA